MRIMKGSRTILRMLQNFLSSMRLLKCVRSAPVMISLNCSMRVSGNNSDSQLQQRSMQQFIYVGIMLQILNQPIIKPHLTNLLYFFSFIGLQCGEGGYNFKLMSQQFLTNFSVIAIKYIQPDSCFYLGNQSFIRSEIIMRANQLQSLFENYLFYVEIDSGSSAEFRTPIEFQQSILLRHKISNKYLSYSSEFENEANDTTVKLELSEEKAFFKILPCFQYQTKISNKVKFNEDIYLATELNSTKIGFLTLRDDEDAGKKKTLIGLNYKTKIMLQMYYQREKEEVGYIYGQAVWLSHIESNTFLTTLKPDNKEEISFQELKAEETLQSINGLWLIDSIKPETGGHLYFGDAIRLKSLCTGRYLAFSPNYKLIENQRVYSLLLQEKPTSHSKFTFLSLKGEENRILKGSYLIFHHQESGEYIGTRRKQRGEFNGYLPVNNFTEFQDEDLFQIKELDENAEQAIRFIFSIRKEFKYIKSCFADRKPLSKSIFRQFKTLYLNIKQELVKLSHHSELFLEVQEQLGFYISQFCEHVKQLRMRRSSDGQVEQLTKSIYEILVILCKDFRENQVIGYTQLMIFIEDIFKNYGAEELICEIFKNNYSLLCRGPNEEFGGCNIVRQIFRIVLGESNGEKATVYWGKISKILNILQILVSFKGVRIDINQRLISSQLFQNGIFNRIFFEIKTLNQRIRVFHPHQKKWMEIEQVREKQLQVILQRIFLLFSLLCQNRNFISKRYIHSYINDQNREGIEIIISYLNVQLSRSLTNNLFSFITNCYIDSAPRISRHRPLALIIFQTNNKEVSNNLSAEETIMSGRLRDALLDNAERSYATRPVDLPSSSIRPMASQPSLSSQQLSYFKEYLSEKINENSWSPDLLRSIRILMQLQCYSVKEIQAIKSLLNNKILIGKMPADIVEHSMQFFEEVCVYCLEVELKKINIFLQMRFCDNRADITQHQIPYLLSSNQTIHIPMIPDAKVLMSAQSELKKKLSQGYNIQASVLSILYAGKQLRESVLKMFLSGHHYSFSVLSIIFKMMRKFYLPKLQLVRLLTKSIIIPEQQIPTYEQLFAIYKRMKYLVSISQNWINNQNQRSENEEVQEFLRLVNRLTNYIFGDLQEGDLNKLRFGAPTNIKHQLLLANFSLHLIILELLNKNFYLIEGKNRKNIPKKQKEVFEACFLFLQNFCKRSPQNIQLIIKNIYIIDRYRKLSEMGQIRVLTLLYNEQPSLSKMVNIAFFQSIINKIVKDGKGNQNCQYNPDYIEFLFACCYSKKTLIKRNLEMINKILEKETIFRRLLFMEVKGGQYQLSLDILKFKSEPLQVPFIYHKEIIKFLTFLIVELQAAGNQLKNRLKQYITPDQLFELLATPDIYSSNGVLPELNFLLKKEIYPLITVYLDKNDSLIRYNQSQFLNQLLTSYLSIINNQKELQSIQIQNEYLMIPYLKKYRKSLDSYKINFRDYYTKEIKPLINPFFLAFEKLPHKQKSKIYQKLLVLIQNVTIDNLTHNHLIQENPPGISLINIRWQNFVDDDEDNSHQEKYAKKNVLELLRNKTTYRMIEQEKQELFRCLKLEEKEFLAAMSRLVKMAVTEESTLDQAQQAFENFYLTVQSTAEYLAWRSKSQEKKNWQGKELVETLIDYVARQSFNYNQPLARKSMYQILRIFNLLLKEDTTDYLVKQIYKFFNENPSCNRFFSCLRDCVAETSLRMDSNIYYQQINLVMSEVYLCGEQRRLQIDKQALRFITLLCKYSPFTEFLRDQPFNSSIDFLDKIYNSFYFMIRQNRNDKLTLTVNIVDISQSILDCVTAFLNGCNQTNQNFIVDNKFTEIVTDALKMQSIRKGKGKTELARRNRLLEEIIEFYASNGINLSEILIQRIKVIDFRGEYLLNRFKYNILRLLLQCTLANDRSTNKVRILVPSELLKINLIWLYEDYIKSELVFKESLILRPRDEWIDVVEKQLNSIFLMIGFYYYQLIEFSSDSEKQGEDDEVEVTNDVEKQKEKIVKKFFSTINDKDHHAQKIKSLEREPFAEEMIKYHNKYYQAFEFFKKKTLTIQANIFDNLVKIYFPKLPLCQEFTQQMQNQLIENAERISQDQKLKSLMEFEKNAYEILQGQQDYEQQIANNHPVLGKIIKLMKNQEDIFLATWLVSCILILMYLIDDFNSPAMDFNASFGTYLTPTFLLDFLLLLVSLCNLFLGLLILLNLIVKKIPFFSRFYQKRYDEQEGEKGNLITFKIKNILSRTFFDLYVITFSILSITHPLFAGFLTVYIVNRISLGKQIVQAIVETWFSLIIATGLLIVFNYIYSIYIYSASFTDDTGYGTTCTNLFRCLLMLVDQSLKSGSGFLGTAVDNNNYNNMVANMKFLSEITYIIFAQKVIFQIFSGTIIDKFSELREKGDSTEEDEESKCFICGQQRFQIDFQLEGFEQHVSETHNKFYYIYYVFYLRRKNKNDFGIEQKYIWDNILKDSNGWIPDGTSLLKGMKEKEDAENQEAAKQPEHEKYYEKKIQELKKVRQRIENYNNQLKDDTIP